MDKAHDVRGGFLLGGNLRAAYAFFMGERKVIL